MRTFATLFLVIGLLVTCSVNVDNIRGVWVDVISNMQWAFQRVISFVIGMYLAPMVREGRSIVSWLAVVAISLVAYIAVHFFINKDLFAMWMLVPAVSIVFALIFEHAHTYRWALRFLAWMGMVSLESYLANIYLQSVISDASAKFLPQTLQHGHYLEYCLVIVCGLILSLVVNKVSARITKTLWM